ncbi:DUF2017 domain-containing protein [Flexivirga caeni]|uniref:DUF2017 domain-containing protein n=1 Tax=Flexivirga caeni TaxID=2294115 RepID=A0A3M9MCJ0_9MICO|nr:DUF2017 domain-containing protein [Flexivirga caeni]RNI23244.1 DUF2017 domain-containing protein [Flexivirga caeni]
MATAFRRKGSRVVAKLDGNERAIVRELLDQTRQLLAPSGGTGDPVEDLFAGLGETPDPDELAHRDPALARLLPDGHRDDPEVAAEFRALTENGLRQRKTANLSTAIEALDQPATRDKLELDLGQAQALLIGLSDVRLALGERLGLRTDEDSEQLQQDLAAAGAAGADDPQLVIGLYYDFLTWLQESLALALR